MKPEEKLQTYLQQIEAGKPLSQVLASLPEEHRDLSDLLILAEHARSISHPSLPPATARQQRQDLQTAAQTVLQAAPVPKPPPALLRRLAPHAFTAASLVLVVVIAVTASLLSYLSALQGIRQASFDAVFGIVEASAPDGSGSWGVMSNGDTVEEGARLRTRSDSTAVLRFYDGSQASLGPNSEVLLTRLDGGYNPLRGKRVQVQMQQFSGQTYHAVETMNDDGSMYEVLTPSGQAAGRGAMFNVVVGANRTSRFAVARGEVEVRQFNMQVFLHAGQATISSPGQNLLPPAFEYFVQGQISAIQGDQWTVNGVTFAAAAPQSAETDFKPGDWVSVLGRIQYDGSYIADQIVNANIKEPGGYFTGSVEQVNGSSLIVSGKPVLIENATDLTATVNVNDIVKVPFVSQQNGSLMAISIDRLGEPNPGGAPAQPVQDSALKPNPSRTPPGQMEPSRQPQHTPKAEKTPQPAGTPSTKPTQNSARNGCEATDQPNPAGEALAQQWGVPYAEIMDWFCKGYGFGEIDLAYELSALYDGPVSDVFAQKQAGSGWGVIKQSATKRTPPGLENNKPDKTPQPKTTPDKNPPSKDNPGGGNDNNGKGDDNNGKNK